MWMSKLRMWCERTGHGCGCDEGNVKGEDRCRTVGRRAFKRLLCGSQSGSMSVLTSLVGWKWAAGQQNPTALCNSRAYQPESQ